MPAPPSITEALQRVNEALPAGLAVAYRPIARGGRRSAQPYRVVREGHQVQACASLVGAIFVANRYAGDRRLQQPSLPYSGDLFA